MKLVIPHLNTFVNTDYERNNEGWLPEELFEKITEQFEKLKADDLDNNNVYEITEINKTTGITGEEILLVETLEGREFEIDNSDLIGNITIEVKK